MNRAQPNHNDLICSHLYHNGYMKGLYYDLIVRISSKDSSVDNLIFKLHKIIAVNSPTILGLLQDRPELEVTLQVTDDLVTPGGLGIAFGHLYANYSMSMIKDLKEEEKPEMLVSVMAASSLLQLNDLFLICTDIIKQSVNLKNVLQYCVLLNDTQYQSSRDLKDFLFTYLCKIGDVLVQEIGLVWGAANQNGRAYSFLVEMFTSLPFEWFKSIIECKYFQVPSDMERFTFAKCVVEQRSKKQNAVEENVLFSFGGKSKGVTVVRKQKSVIMNGERRVWKAAP